MCQCSWAAGAVEALSLLGRLAASGSQLAGRLEHTVNAGGADGHDIRVEHHVGQPPISFQGVEVMEGDDRGLLPNPPAQKSRGSDALCRLGVPSRLLQRLNWVRAIPSHWSNRKTGNPVLPAQPRMNWTTASRTAWGTRGYQSEFPKIFF